MSNKHKSESLNDMIRRILQDYGVDPDQYTLATHDGRTRYQQAFDDACKRQIAHHTDHAGRRWHGTRLN